MRTLKLSSALALLLLPHSVQADHLTEMMFPLTVEQTNPAAVFAPGATLPSGMASVTIDSDAMTIAWDVDYQDLSGPIVAPGAHFHGPAALGTNAGVQIFLTDGSPPEPATGNLTGSAPLNAQQLSDVLAGLWYLNIHTADNQPGELRGQVVNIPEPAALTMLASLAAATMVVRRRRTN